MISIIFKRELRLALRGAAGTGLSLAFMALFVLLCGFAVGGFNPDLAPGLLWLAALLSTLLGLDRLYQPDQDSGALAQLYLAGVSGTDIVVGKALAFALTGLLPLIFATPFLSLLLGLEVSATLGTVLSLLIGAPAILAYTSVTAALLSGQRGSGVLAVLLTAPLLVPVLIFGIGAASVYTVEGLGAVQFRILAGLSFIALALGIPASVAALAANRGPE